MGGTEAKENHEPGTGFQKREMDGIGSDQVDRCARLQEHDRIVLECK